MMGVLQFGGIGLALAVGAFAATSASAEVYDWTFVDNLGSLVASGTLTTGSPVIVDVPGAETVSPVLSASGSILGVDGFTAESLALYGSYTTPLGYNTVDGQTYDNAVYASVPYIDGNGLEFTGGTSGEYYNIFNNVNTGYYSPGNYPNNDVIWNNLGPTPGGTFSITAVPEPSTWTMMLLGFIGIGFFGYRAAKGAAAAAVAG